MSMWLPIISPAAGFLGALVQKAMGLYGDNQKHKQEMERLELASRIDVQRADILLRQITVGAEGQAFTAAINAQAATAPAGAWAKDVVSLFRPGLTSLVLCASIGHAIWLMSRGENATEFWQGIHSLSAMSFSYWFGIRTVEKLAEIRLAAPLR